MKTLAAPPPVRPLAQREVGFLRALHWRGALTCREFNLCRLMAESLGYPMSDRFLTWLSEIPAGEMERHRRRLHRRKILAFTPAEPPGSFSCRVLVPKAYCPAPALSPRLPTGFPAPERWVVLDQGRRAHLLRADDLFPAERTFCGKPALDADWQALPRLNSPPADYQTCARCQQVRASQP